MTKKNELSCWFKRNKLSLDVAKTTCNCIFFAGNKRVGNIKLEIDEMEINQQKHVKFLGVVVDEKLNWEAHLQDKNNVCSIICFKSVTRLPK